MLIDVYNQGEKLYQCTDAYKPVENPSEWLPCPECGLKPLVWTFDNGRILLVVVEKISMTISKLELNQFAHISIDVTLISMKNMVTAGLMSMTMS